MDILFASLSDMTGMLARIFSIGSTVWFFAFPLFAFPLFFYLWMLHIWGKYDATIARVLLEITPPRDIEKSPQLMEGLFDGIAGSDKGFTKFEEYVLGQFPAKFSLEIMGSEGRIHFYIYTPVIMRNLIEAHLYAQYPDVEITEVADYVDSVPKNLPDKDWNLWGSDFSLMKDDAYPIKTYHNFEETVTGKMMDPLAGLVEVIGKLPPGQKIWLQYIISPERPSWYDKQGRKLVDQLVQGKKPKPESVMAMLVAHLSGILKGVFGGILGLTEQEVKKSDAKDLGPIEFRLTPVQRKVLEAVESNIGRNVFKVKMRFMYLGRRENYNSGAFLAAIMGAITKPYNDGNLNSLAVDFTKTSAEYVFMKSRLQYAQKRLFRRYRDRDREPGKNMFILSSAELATLFHLPDGSILSPALTRVAAKRSGAPSNIPTQL